MTLLSRILKGLCVVLVVLVASTTASQAEISSEKKAYYKRWQATADRAETEVDKEKLTNAAFEQLRAELAGFRETFISSRSANSDRIKTLQSQISALGDKPEDHDESSDIAKLRKSLTKRLQTLQLPRIVSEEAYFRANGLISEIDSIIRHRHTDELLSRGASPLDPLLWPIAAGNVKDVIHTLISEVLVHIRSDNFRKQITKNLPLIVVLLGVGGVLLVKSSRWAERMGEFMRSYGGAGTGVWSFLVSLTKIILPLFGVLLVVTSLSLTGAFGLRTTYLLEAVPRWAGILLVYNWLGYQLSFRREDMGLPPASSTTMAEIRFYTVMLAVMLVVQEGIEIYEQFESISNASHAVIEFPPIVFTALILLRLQRIALGSRAEAAQTSDDAPRKSGFSRVVPVLRRAVMFFGIFSPILAMVGYGAAAEAIVYPAVWTLGVISLILILQRFIGDVYSWISGNADTVKESLFIVLVGFSLILISLPLLALIWGARVADLTELWARFLEGYVVGETRISPLDFLTFAIIFAVGYLVTRIVQSGLRNSLLPKTSIDPGAQNAIVSGTGYVGIFLAALMAVTGTGLNLSSLAIVAGALSVGIGFGLQTIVSNFVSGIILLVERPISKGDWIEVGGLMGYVRDISVRSTRIETFDRTDVIVPNSDLISGMVTNYTRGNTIGRVIVPVGVAYGSDTKRIEGILREVANTHPMVLANPAPSIVFQGFGDSSLNFEIRAILRDVNWVLSVKSDLNHEIAKRFAEEGIEIPFVQRDLWLRNPEALPGATAFTPSSRHNFTHEAMRPAHPSDVDPDTPDEA